MKDFVNLLYALTPYTSLLKPHSSMAVRLFVSEKLSYNWNVGQGI